MINTNQWKQVECPSKDIFDTFIAGIHSRGYDVIFKDVCMRNHGAITFYYKEVLREWSWGARLIYKGKPCLFLKYNDDRQFATIVPENAPWTKVVCVRELLEEV